MAAKIKTALGNNKGIIIGTLCIIVIAAMCWMLRTNHTASDNTDNTIKSIKTDLGRTGETLNRARDKLDNAGLAIDRGTEIIDQSQDTISDIKERNNRNKELVRKCLDLNRKAQNISSQSGANNQKRATDKKAGAMAK